ncbi:MAG TPA: hypothetical protein VFT29_20820 [Gemmatimonadaceae bacterium]|nr:hypothetical protein [Gemmatimonadaceae bacterium]
MTTSRMAHPDVLTMPGPVRSRSLVRRGLLALAFGVGVHRAAGRNRALRIVGALVIGYAALGFAGPTLFPMHQRGTEASDLTVIVFGALTVPYAKRLATGQPTPGFGIIERIDIYSWLLWVAVLAVALRRRAEDASRTTTVNP